MSPFDLSGRVAVVVGGTSGIGREIALGLAEAGAHTVPVGRRRADDLLGEIRAKGVETIDATADVGDRASLNALRDIVVDRFGEVDILVNCAGGRSANPPRRWATRSGTHSWTPT